MFALIVESQLQRVPREAGSETQSNIRHPRLQAVAGVLHVGADAQLCVRLRLIQPIFPLDVIVFLFVGGEGGILQGQEGVGIEMARQGEGSEIGAEEVFSCPSK